MEGLPEATMSRPRFMPSSVSSNDSWAWQSRNMGETDWSSVEMLAGLQQGTKSTHHSADTFHPSINWYTQSINSSNDKLYQLTESLRTLHQLTDMHHPPINWHAPSINQLKHSSNQSVNWHTPSSNWSTETLHQLINWNTPPIKWSTVTLHQSFG